MAKFDDTVSAVRSLIASKRVLHAVCVREGRRRRISVGPYRTATGERLFALIVQPALPSWRGDDMAADSSSDQVARAFVRLVGTGAAAESARRAG